MTDRRVGVIGFVQESFRRYYAVQVGVGHPTGSPLPLHADDNGRAQPWFHPRASDVLRVGHRVGWRDVLRVYALSQHFRRRCGHLLFSSSGELFLTLPTSLETSKTLHLVGGERAQQVDRRLVGRLAVEPAVEVAGVQDDGHAVVDGCHQLVRVGGDDCEAL